MRTTDFLRSVPVLAGLAEDLLERVAGEVEDVSVPAGEWLMREGDDADRMFIVRAGRLEVVHEGPPQTVLRILRRGDVVGELALLQEGTRSASVRARRDSELLALRRESFEALIQEVRGFAIGLMREMGRELARSRPRVVAAPRPRTIAVVGLDAGAPVAEVVDGLAVALRQHGSVAVVDSGELSTIDQAGRDAGRVLLRGREASGGWTQLCVDEADLLVAVTTGAPSVEWSRRATLLEGCELLVFGALRATAALDALLPRELQVIAEPARRGAALQSLGRRIAGRSIGLVLSGGGARALAGLGVVEELTESGLQIDRIAGVSLGALVAAMTAADFPSEERYEAFRRYFIGTNPSNDVVPPLYSMLRGAKTRRLLREALGDRRIEALPLRYFCVSCDLVAREAVVHRRGPVADAAYASLAIPGVFPPVPTADGRLLVDGGVLDNLPVETMARTGEGPVIAVDVTDRMPQLWRTPRPRTARLGRPLRRALTGSDAEIPRLAETIMRTLTVGSIDTVAAARAHADLVISPRVDGVGLGEWKALDRVREVGRQAARQALASGVEL